MEALLTTVGLLVVIALGLVLLARTWPRSSRGGGYHAWSQGGDPGSPESGATDERAQRGDAEGHWPTGE